MDFYTFKLSWASLFPVSSHYANDTFGFSRQKTGISVLCRKRSFSFSQAQFEMLEHTATSFLAQWPWMLHQIALARLTLHRDTPDRQRVGFVDVRTRGEKKKELAFISQTSCGGCQGSDGIFWDAEQPPESLFQRKSPSVQFEARGHGFACT